MMKTFNRKRGLRSMVLTIFASLTLAALAPTTTAFAATLDSEETSFCQLINTYRAQNGLAPLLVSTSLTNDAKWMSGDMAQKNYFSHTDSLGRDAFQRMAAFGYSYPTAEGENIAAGSSTAAATFTQWKNSPGHNANMLSPSYAVMGIGRAYQSTSQYGWYWTNAFGGFNDSATPCPSPVLPVLTINDISVTEGNSGTRSATFTVTRAGDTSGASSVKYATANGSATAGSDYVAVPLSTLNFATGETTRTVAVTVNGDTAVEVSETFSLNLSSATGATISDASGTGTIQNDDSTATPAASLTVNDVSVTEGNSGTKAAAFTVSRAGDTSGTSSVKYATANGSALGWSDYLPLPLTTLTFAPGEATKAVPVTVKGDTDVEPSETFVLNLSSVTGATISDASATGTIQNDDTNLRVNDISFGEGNTSNYSANFNVVRMGDTSRTSTVQYATADGTAVAGSDYLALPLATLTFAPGETTKAVTVTSIGDTTPEPAETFFLKLSSPTGATIFSASGTATINDADDNIARIAVNDVSVTEGNSGTKTATFTITRSVDTSGTAPISYSTANGTATAGSDYVALPSTTVNFAPGETTKTVAVTINGDTTPEASETFTLRLSSPTGLFVTHANGVGTVQNDDGASA